MIYQNEKELVLSFPELSIFLRAQGPFEWTKTPFLEESRQNGKLHGVCRFFCGTEKKQLLSEKWFWEDLQIGIGKSYYLSGSLYRLERFQAGQKEGAQEAYYQNGQIKTKEFFHAGKREGEALLFWLTGKIKRKALFSEGKLMQDELFNE